MTDIRTQKLNDLIERRDRLTASRTEFIAENSQFDYMTEKDRLNNRIYCLRHPKQSAKRMRRFREKAKQDWISNLHAFMTENRVPQIRKGVEIRTTDIYFHVNNEECYRYIPESGIFKPELTEDDRNFIKDWGDKRKATK